MWIDHVVLSTIALFFFQKYKTEIKDLEHQGELGNGTCGHVVKMRHKPSETVIAVKVTNILCLTYIVPAVHRNIMCIVKQTRCTNVSNLFYFGMTLYMFQTVFPSIISSSRLHTATGTCQTDTADCLLASRQQYLFGCCMYRRWTERPSETCRASFQNKINLIHWCL